MNITLCCKAARTDSILVNCFLSWTLSYWKW